MPLKPAVTTTRDAVYLFGGCNDQNHPLDQLLKISVKPGTEDNALVRMSIKRTL